MMFRSSEAMLRNYCQPTADPLYTHSRPIAIVLLPILHPPRTHFQSRRSFCYTSGDDRTGTPHTDKKRSVLPLNTPTGGSFYGKSVSKKDGLLDLPQNGYGANGTRKGRLFAHRRKRHLNNIKIEEVIAAETKRLSEMFGKTFLDCEDLIKLTGLGRDNVRLLMRSRRFPVVKVGKRQVVSILNFVAWQIRESAGGDFNGR